MSDQPLPTIPSLQARAAERNERMPTTVAELRYDLAEAAADIDSWEQIVAQLVAAVQAMDATWQRHGNYFLEAAFAKGRTLLRKLGEKT